MATHVLRPAVPLRSFVVAAVLAVVGAAMVLGSRVGGNLWLLGLGGLLLADSVALVLMTTLSSRRARVAIDLDETGYVVHSREGDIRGRWDAVTRVTRSEDGTRLVFHQGAEQRLVLIGRDVGSLENDVVHYLDKNRGYGTAGQ